MKTETTRLSGVDTITVADIMTRDVWTVTPETAVGELVQLLVEQKITGAPVAMRSGELRGVVSVADVLRLAADEALGSIGDGSWEEEWDDFDRRVDGATSPSFFRDATGHRWVFGSRARAAALRCLPFADYEVSDIMMPATFTVRPRATLRELARFLVRARIHRALVVENGRPTGIVTASAVVRAIVDS